MFALSLWVALAPMPVAQREPRQRGEQWHVLQARKGGRILPQREILARVLPSMRGADYLGLDFDGDRAVYTLKFVRNGAVIWVEVDGRSGQVLGRTGL